MGLSLFRVCLVIHTFTITKENPVTHIPYRFPVYPVNKCPTNENEFQTAAQRRNCTRGLRYLCAPNKYLSSLIEFCTDRTRGLYEKGNCLLLDGTGDLNHYSCLEKFKRSCPSKPYNDEEIYKYPVCLEIDEELRCFVADKDCMKRHFPTTETYLNISNKENVGNGTIRGASHEWIAIVYITIALLLAGMILSWVIFQKRKKEQEKKSEGNDENVSLVKDPEPPIENDDSQLDQAPVNVSIQNLMQTTLATELISETTNRYTKTLPRDNQNQEESRQNTTLIDGIQQDDLQIDDDKLRVFLSKGELTVCHVRCIIVGCGKAGKTTLLKRLQNLSYDEVKQTESTEMVDFHVNSFEVLLEEETIQSVKKEDTSSTILFSKEKLEKMHANAGQWTAGMKIIENGYDEHAEHLGVRRENGPTIFEKPALKETRHSQIENLSMNILRNPAATHSAENKETPTLEPHKIQSSSETYQKQNEEIEKNADNDDIEEYAISKIKDAVNELLNEHDLRPRITFLDFAGQSMYYAFHQIFLRPKSCSILVVDMTKRLDDKVDVKNKDEKDCSLFASWRYRDYYKFWLKSIDSFSDITTPVIVVGTHADKLSEEKCDEFFDEFFKLFDDWPHFDLRRHLNTDRIYTIGFPEPGSVELKDLKDIKKCIADILTAPGYLEENIRPVWALYEHILIKMKETRKIISRKTLSDCSDQLSAPGLRLSDDEISKMLIFLHRVGILLYFEEDDLRGKIILDIQWLLDAFKCIINYRVKADVNDMKRTHFYRTGELDDAELDRIWKIEKKEYLEHKTTIIAYMQQLGLLMTFPTLRCVPSTVYYIPCMNSKKFDKTGANNSKSSILCFKFEETKQLPTNVFYGIVSKCLENWSILTEKTKDNTCLYHNAACFSFENHVVVLCICKFQILVQVWALPEIYDAKFLKEIKQSVEKIIQEYKMISYKVGYKCQRDMLNAEKDLSFIPENIFPVSNFLCETCDVEKKHPVGNDTCWECGKFMEDFSGSVDSGNLQRHLNRDRKFITGFPETGNEPENIKDLKKCLAEIVQGGDVLEQKLRPVCKVCEDILIRVKKEKKIISRQTLLNYKDKLSTEIFKIDDDEISHMLLFLNSVGTILYFKEDYLKDKIILDIQWFSDAFKCILHYPSAMTGSDSKRRRFYETGELDDEELNRIWKKCKNKGSEYFDHKSTILAYMEQLGLLAESTSHTCIPQSESVNSTWYYVPSMNKRKFDKTGEEFSKSSILCFKFDDGGQLPIHVFYGLVVKCFKIPEWSILTENGENCMYENAACFSFKEHILVLFICNFEIRMQVWWFPGRFPDAKLLEGIQDSVLNILKMYTKYSYEVGYKCQNGMINATENKSFIAQSKFPLSDFLCRECDVDKMHPVSNDTSWIQQTNTLDNKGIIERVIKLLQSSSEVSPLDVAKKCIDKTASKKDVNRYLHYLEKSGFICVKYLNEEKKSNPVWSALPKARYITEEKMIELASEISKSPSKSRTQSELVPRLPDSSHQYPTSGNSTPYHIDVGNHFHQHKRTHNTVVQAGEWNSVHYNVQGIEQ